MEISVTSSIQHRRRMARYLFRRQGARCYLCQVELEKRGVSMELWESELVKSPRGFTFEHVENCGRKNRRDSMRGKVLLACAPCNHAKGARAPRACELMMLNEVWRKSC